MVIRFSDIVDPVLDADWIKHATNGKSSVKDIKATKNAMKLHNAKSSGKSKLPVKLTIKHFNYKALISAIIATRCKL